MRGLFVTGTDTGVGKTTVAAAIVRSLVSDGRRVGAMKPVATGATSADSGFACDDRDILAAALGMTDHERVTPILFEPPLAPPVAARKSGRPLTYNDVWTATRDALDWWSQRADIMVIEGVGGLLCPLAGEATVADLAIALDFPLVIVARLGLGTLNHTLLTVEAALRRGLRVAGVILNQPDDAPLGSAEETNPGELSRHLRLIPVLAQIKHFSDPVLLSETVERLDWYHRACTPRLMGRGMTAFSSAVHAEVTR